jgi:hypothetical protein
MEEFLEQVQRDEIEDAPLQTPVNSWPCETIRAYSCEAQPLE